MYVLRLLCMSMFLRVYSFGKEGAGINNAQTWKIKCKDNTVGVVLKYVYKFFENTPPKRWKVILFSLSVDWN